MAITKIYQLNKENGEIEHVEGERWRWQAYYQNDEVLYQFNDTDNAFHQFKEIDQSKLVSFIMTNGEKVHTLTFDPTTDKLIHFYKNIIVKDGITGEFISFTRIYCYGIERNKQKILHIILPDDNIVTTDDIDKIQFE